MLQVFTAFEITKPQTHKMGEPQNDDLWNDSDEETLVNPSLGKDWAKVDTNAQKVLKS